MVENYFLPPQTQHYRIIFVALRLAPPQDLVIRHMLVFYRCSSFSNSHCYLAWQFLGTHTHKSLLLNTEYNEIFCKYLAPRHLDCCLGPLRIMSRPSQLACPEVLQSLGAVLHSTNELLQWLLVALVTGGEGQECHAPRILTVSTFHVLQFREQHVSLVSSCSWWFTFPEYLFVVFRLCKFKLHAVCMNFIATLRKEFLANVNVSLRSLYVVVRPSVVCLSVTLGPLRHA